MFYKTSYWTPGDEAEAGLGGLTTISPLNELFYICHSTCFPFSSPMPSARTSPASLLPTENKPINQSVLALCPVIAPHVHPSQALITKWHRGAHVHQISSLRRCVLERHRKCSPLLFQTHEAKWSGSVKSADHVKGLVLKLQYVHPRRLASALWW